MKLMYIMSVSDKLIQLFQHHEYEKYVLDLMNLSESVFPNKYKAVIEQSHGECDFIDVDTLVKYDTKLPFSTEQVKLLTSGKKHPPKIKEWIEELLDEASEYDLNELRQNPEPDLTNEKLYKIMKEKITANKALDENLVFFFPFPIVTSVPGSIFLQFASDYLTFIYEELKKDEEIDLSNRSIYAIYPSSQKNVFTLRNLSSYHNEYVYYNKFEYFFSHEVTNVQI